MLKRDNVLCLVKHHIFGDFSELRERVVDHVLLFKRGNDEVAFDNGAVHQIFEFVNVVFYRLGGTY